MTERDAIVNPFKWGGSDDFPPVAVLAAMENETLAICGGLGLEPSEGVPMMLSRLYVAKNHPANCSLTGPVVGAPYAVMLLEILIASGAKRIVFYGLCGAISSDVKIGDIILPTGAIIDEGTSSHYDQKPAGVVQASETITNSIKSLLTRKKIIFHEGLIWTTDAIFRETREKVRHYQGKKVLGVEMETSALFSAGRFRNVDVGAVLVVSDELSSMEWNPGFGHARLSEQCRIVQETIIDLCRIL